MDLMNAWSYPVMPDELSDAPIGEANDPWRTRLPGADQKPKASPPDSPLSLDKKIYGSLLSQVAPGYELVDFLGEGAFGQVWSAKGHGGVNTAIKFIRLRKNILESERRSLDLTKNVSHPNLIHISSIWYAEGFVIIAMELCQRTLLDRLEEARKQGLVGIPPQELLEYITDAAKGIDHLNSV